MDAPRDHGAVALGLDIGTSSARAVVATDAGDVLGAGTAKYPLIASRPGEAEQEPADWWRGAVAATQAALLEARTDAVDGIGLSGQMHGAVLVDADLEPLRPALLWCDSRAAEDAAAVTDAAGRQALLAMAGNVPMAGFTGPQLRWLDRAGALSAARWAICAKDFVRARMTGEVATDPSDASGTGLFGLDGHWSVELAALYGVDDALLAPVVESGAPAGRLTAAAADVLGLPEGTPVAAGAADNAAAALGCGVIAPGDMLISLGTSGTIVIPVPEPLVDPTGSCHVFRHAVEDTWYSMPVVLDAGGALAWWQTLTGRPMEELAAAASATPPGSDGVVMVPFLSGRRMPVADPAARATFSGMSLSHGLGHMTRAAIEGATFAMADGLRCLRRLGLEETDAVLTGGAASHAIWREALALAMPDVRLSTAVPAGGAALGAAFLGLAAAGAPLTPLVRRVIAYEPIAPPEVGAQARAAVRAGYDRYRALAAATASRNTTVEETRS
jgi:xylulokinase